MWKSARDGRDTRLWFASFCIDEGRRALAYHFAQPDLVSSVVTEATREVALREPGYFCWTSMSRRSVAAWGRLRRLQTNRLISLLLILRITEDSRCAKAFAQKACACDSA